jgi:hypothetical protein
MNLKSLRMNRIERRGAIHAFCYAAGVTLALTGASVAQAAGDQPAAKAVWPDNGIAQRQFPGGSTMFVENDHGQWRAWVLSEATGDADVEALDFFSGQRMKVKVDLEDDGRQDQSFTDAKGKFHSTAGRQFEFSGTSLPINLEGLSFDGNNLFLKSSASYCSSNLIATTPAKDGNASAAGTSSWSKFTIYHTMGVSKCPNGMFDSKITSALDLNDGTFLAVEGCFVFRLRKSDLTPVGSAPALHVVDESTVSAAIEQAKAKNAQDVTDYLVKTLKIRTDPELSCKDD